MKSCPVSADSPDCGLTADVLYFVIDRSRPTNIKNAFFFNIEQDGSSGLRYIPFNEDFGPLNLACVHRFCRELLKLLALYKKSGAKIFHYTQYTTDCINLTNSAFLVCASMLVCFRMTSDQALARVRPYSRLFRSYRDASRAENQYQCTLEHCVRGLEFGLKSGWYDFKTFNVKEYEHYEKVKNGDLNWIIPGKFLAFMGPIDQQPGEQKTGHSAKAYINIFKHLNVTKVIRLNEPHYRASVFTESGIDHDDFIFVDGSVPPQPIIDNFLASCRAHFAKPNSGAIAVHCKAGLGRTGTLIGIYAMMEYGITASAFIGWNRIARPGSILGPQ